MEGELAKIKKIYGENFAKLCRSLFPTILEEEGKLLEVLQAKFAPTRSLYEDLASQNKIHEFKYYIYHEAGIRPAKIVDIKERPEKLMAKAGYKLYRCKTNRDIDHFKKYYNYDELLCTFTDPARISTHHVFFAVKKGAERLRRQDFLHPRREDEYGTSVISIQFNKADNDVSIKNRYNHSVDNPDSTFYNDLENIIPGLTSSFAKYYGLDPVVDYGRYSFFTLDGYVFDENKQRHKYNQKFGEIYFCENNIVINDGEVVEYDRSRYELVDCYLIDRSQKTIKSLLVDDSFVNGFGEIEKIDVEKADHGGKKITITFDGGKKAYITTNRTNAIVAYENEHITKVGDAFMKRNTQLRSLSLPNVEEVKDGFCTNAKKLTNLQMPKLKSTGNGFMTNNNGLKVVDLPELKFVGRSFMQHAVDVEELILPRLEVADDKFMGNNKGLTELSLPSLRIAGNDFLAHNNKIASVSLPSLVEAMTGFMRFNQSLTEISLPKIKNIGSGFFHHGRQVRYAYLPELESVGADFLHDTEKLEEIVVPNIRSIGDNAMIVNETLREFIAPKLSAVGVNFLFSNEILEKFVAPELAMVDAHFMARNKSLKEISCPKLQYIDMGFLWDNESLEYINLPRIKNMPLNIQKLIDKMNAVENE